MISSRSRYVSEYRRYQRTQRRMITSSKCRPRNSAGLFRVTISRYQISSLAFATQPLTKVLDAPPALVFDLRLHFVRLGSFQLGAEPSVQRLCGYRRSDTETQEGARPRTDVDR